VPSLIGRGGKDGRVLVAEYGLNSRAAALARDGNGNCWLRNCIPSPFKRPDVIPTTSRPEIRVTNFMSDTTKQTKPTTGFYPMSKAKLPDLPLDEPNCLPKYGMITRQQTRSVGDRRPEAQTQCGCSIQELGSEQHPITHECIVLNIDKTPMNLLC
jgi:hypothetical protein